MKKEENYIAMIDEYIEDILKTGSPEYPVWNQEMIRQKRNSTWNYIDGTMMTALMRLYESTGEKRYLDFCDNFIDYFVREDGSIREYSKEEFNLDNIKEGSVLFRLHDCTGKEKYRKAMDTLYSQLMDQPRTAEGNFWHKGIYPGQVWLDGLYMAQPFYLEYEKRYNGKKCYDDIFSQFRNVVAHMRDRKTGLYFHAWDTTGKMFWADKKTGLSRSFWLRALGWYVMALVDILEILDSSEDREFYHFISDTFTDLVGALLDFQDESGLWYQVVDQGSSEGNYLETSGSAIISYAILKAVSNGILPVEMAEPGRKAFLGICDRYLRRGEDRKMNLGGICLMAGLGGSEMRDGSFDYYMSEPVVENEAKGIGPFLLADIFYKENFLLRR